MSAPSPSHGPMIAIGISIALAGAALLTTALTGIAGAVPGHDPVTICHWIPAHGGSYNEITVDDDGSFQGHASHPNDIIPAPAGGCPGSAQATASPDATRPVPTHDRHSPTAAPTLTHTHTPTATPAEDTITPQASLTSTATATATETPTPVPTTTDTPTATGTVTSTSTPTSVPTATDTATATASGTATATETPSAPSETPTPTTTATVLIEGSVTPLATDTSTPTATNTPASTPTATSNGTVVTQGSITPLPTNTRTTPHRTHTPTRTPTAGTATTVPGATSSPAATPTFVDIVLGATPVPTTVIERLPSTGAGRTGGPGYLALLGGLLIVCGTGIAVTGVRAWLR